VRTGHEWEPLRAPGLGIPSTATAALLRLLGCTATTVVLVWGLASAQSRAVERPRPADGTEARKVFLHDGWRVQSSAEVAATGEQVSQPGFDASGWLPAAVPSTVLAVLVANHRYPDPYFGMQLREIPGTDYPIGANFSNLPMPASSPFHVPWWYRLEFSVPGQLRGRHLWLNFNGINYRAEIWFNGQLIANRQAVAGTFRSYQFEVTPLVHWGALNALAVLVEAPTERDLALTWVDWNPAPPDKNMGLWRSVYWTVTGSVAIRDPYVEVRLKHEHPLQAEIVVSAVVRNLDGRPVGGVLEGSLGRVHFRQRLLLVAGEERTVRFTPEAFPQLRLRRPRLWWPWPLGRPYRYHFLLQFRTANGVSDRHRMWVGLREISTRINEAGAREFSINGRRLFIRGAGWAPDMLLRFSSQREQQELEYARFLGLNAVRLEGKLINEDFFDLTDRLGLLVLAGWCCCDHWERWSQWTREDVDIAAESLRSQILRLRRHPSLLVWLNGSDNPPPAPVERMYLRILAELHWPGAVLSSATARPTVVSGPTGVKMTGPYNWVPPNYWALDRERGGVFGFNTETSPGPAPPPLDSLQRFLPADHLWPIDAVWNFHAGGGRFQTLDVFNQALAARYGPPTSLADYLRKAQAMTYEAERAMFEAYARARYRATGVIQWMLNNAWPSLIWHLYDYYLLPAGGFYGVRKANEPVHIQYDYAGHSVVVSNTTMRPLQHLRARIRLLGSDSQPRWQLERRLSLGPDQVALLASLPALTDPLAFLDLRLDDGAGRTISRNVYWLSARSDVSDFEHARYDWTPTLTYADFTALSRLPRAHVEASVQPLHRPRVGQWRLRLHNASSVLAFLVQARLLGADGREVVPVFWDDNFVCLLPGESRQLTVRLPQRPLPRPLVLTVQGWNTEEVRLPVKP
jgi:exo-1,4-beta-D-glucosaminidase